MKKLCIITAVILLICLCAACAAAEEAAEGSEYLRTVENVSLEQMSAGYWTARCKHAGRVLMTPEEICSANNINDNMLYVGGGEKAALDEIGDTFSGDAAKELIGTFQPPENPEDIYINGKPGTQEFWDELVDNMNLSGIPSSIDVVFGYSTQRASLRAFPTDVFGGRDAEELLYDELVNSEYMPYMPLAVLHESRDGEWYFVMLYGYAGWIQREYVAICPSREDWISRQQNDEFLVVTGRELRLMEDPYTPELSGLILPMGTVLPLVAADEAPESINNRATYGCYVVKLPVRGADGAIIDEYALIPVSDDVSAGYLPYTRANVLELAFKLLGDCYGWAGMYAANDCSGVIGQIYACFGFRFPRNSRIISQMPSLSIGMNGMETDAKRRVIASLKPGSLLYFPGHIMLSASARPR